MRALRWLAAVLVMICLFLSLHTEGMKKYVVVMVFAGGFFFLGRKKKLCTEAAVCVLLPAVICLLAGGVSTLLCANPQMSSVKQAVFWLVPLFLPLALAVFFGNDLKKVIDGQFLACLVTFYVYAGERIINYGVAEDILAFVFGAFVIYYIYEKRWLPAVIAVRFMYVADKKIVLLAVVASVFLLLCTWIFRKSKCFLLTLWGFVTVGCLYYIELIHSGALKHICYSMGIIGNGRMTMYDRFQDFYRVSVTYLGRGFGSVSNILECWDIPTYGHLHNDLLKLYIELGFWGFLAYFVSYAVTFHLAEKHFGKKAMTGLFAMAVYSMILFMTDNVSIYILYLIPVYSISFAMLTMENKNN